MGQDSHAGLEKRCPRSADGTAKFNIFSGDPERFIQKLLVHFSNLLCRNSCRTPFQRPRKIHCRGTGGVKVGGTGFDLLQMLLRRRTFKTLSAHRKSNGGRAPDGRRSADTQLFDGFVDGFGGLKFQPLLFTGQQRLVDDIQNSSLCGADTGGKMLSAFRVHVG